MAYIPLSLILLCPISRNSSLGWYRTTFSAIDFAPSYPILLLKTFKNFKLVLFLRDLASSSAPDTPILFLEISNTSRTWLKGKTSARTLVPSLSSPFLDKSKTLSWHFNPYLLLSKANSRISAMFLCMFADFDWSVVRLELSANIFTYYGYFLFTSLL